MMKSVLSPASKLCFQGCRLSDWLGMHLWCNLHFCLWSTVKGFNNLLKIIQILLLLLWSLLFLNLYICLSLQASLLNVVLPSLFCFLLLLVSSLLSPLLISSHSSPCLLLEELEEVPSCILSGIDSPSNLLNDLLNNCSPTTEFSVRLCSLDRRK